MIIKDLQKQQDRVNELIRAGSAMGSTIGLPPSEFLPATMDLVETTDAHRAAVFIGRFPAGIESVHSFPYTAIETTPAGAYFLWGKDRILYLAPYEEWPSLDTDEAKEEQAQWNTHLQKSSVRKAFGRFREMEKRLVQKSPVPPDTIRELENAIRRTKSDSVLP